MRRKVSGIRYEHTLGENYIKMHLASVHTDTENVINVYSSPLEYLIETVVPTKEVVEEKIVEGLLLLLETNEFFRNIVGEELVIYEVSENKNAKTVELTGDELNIDNMDKFKEYGISAVKFIKSLT